MVEPVVVRFVPGVTPAKWQRAWAERMPANPLEVRLAEQAAAVHAVRSGDALLALVRLPVENADERMHVVPLYEERAVVVAPVEHRFEAAESVTLAEVEAETVLPVGTRDRIEEDVPDPVKGAVELVAANVGVVVLPMSVARLHARKDVVARPIDDAPTAGVGLVWLRESDGPLAQEFMGVVRGRTARSSRGASEPEPEQEPKRKPAAPRTRKPPKPAAKDQRGATPKASHRTKGRGKRR